MCPQNRYPLTIINHQLKKVFSVRLFKIQMGHLCIRVFANWFTHGAKAVFMWRGIIWKKVDFYKHV